MASTKLERLRALHEDIELLERAVVDELDHKKKLVRAAAYAPSRRFDAVHAVRLGATSSRPWFYYPPLRGGTLTVSLASPWPPACCVLRSTKDH